MRSELDMEHNQWILDAELGMRRVAANFVSKSLTADQKEQLINVSEELRPIASDDATFLSRVITDDPETKQ
jgi:hypothetical protein